MRIVITGANRGIGLALTEIYLENGETVIAGVRNTKSESLLKLREIYGDNLQILKLDVSDESSIKNFANSFDGHVDVLINNAGVLFRDSVYECSYDKFLYTLKVNTLGPFFMVHYLLDKLIHSKNPKVVNISSIMGSLQNFSGTHSVSYSTSKAALNMITKALAHQLMDKKIIVISIHPGWVRTDMGGENAPLDPKESAKNITKLIQKITLLDTGNFYDHTGKILEW